eukprot:6157643-Pyramimonas_sp.AAC.1
MDADAPQGCKEAQHIVHALSALTGAFSVRSILGGECGSIACSKHKREHTSTMARGLVKRDEF